MKIFVARRRPFSLHSSCRSYPVRNECHFLVTSLVFLATLGCAQKAYQAYAQVPPGRTPYYSAVPYLYAVPMRGFGQATYPLQQAADNSAAVAAPGYRGEAVANRTPPHRLRLVPSPPILSTSAPRPVPPGGDQQPSSYNGFAPAVAVPSTIAQMAQSLGSPSVASATGIKLYLPMAEPGTRLHGDEDENSRPLSARPLIQADNPALKEPVSFATNNLSVAGTRDTEISETQPRPATQAGKAGPADESSRALPRSQRVTVKKGPPEKEYEGNARAARSPSTSKKKPRLDEAGSTQQGSGRTVSLENASMPTSPRSNASSPSQPVGVPTGDPGAPRLLIPPSATQDVETEDNGYLKRVQTDVGHSSGAGSFDVAPASDVGE